MPAPARATWGGAKLRYTSQFLATNAIAIHKALLKTTAEDNASNDRAGPNDAESNDVCHSPLIKSEFAKLKPDENWRLNALLSKPIILTTVF
jgi:hypothetical protein